MTIQLLLTDFNVFYRDIVDVQNISFSFDSNVVQSKYKNKNGYNSDFSGVNKTHVATYM